MHPELKTQNMEADSHSPEGEALVHADHHPHGSHATGPLRSIEQAKQNKHHRQMSREIRWPITSTSHKLTW